MQQHILKDIIACIQELVDNFQKFFLTLLSKYNVREEFQGKVIRSYNLLDTPVKKKVLDSINDIKIDLKRYNEVKSDQPVGLATSIDASFDESEANNAEPSAQYRFDCLLLTFTFSDIDLLKRKAGKIAEGKRIITGFCDQYFKVQLASTQL